MTTKRIWAIRSGVTGQADSIFIEHNQLALSSAELDDDISKLSPSRSAFKEAFGQAQNNARPESVPMQAGQLFRFVHDVKIGDNVVYPRKSDRNLYWGEIVGPYVFQSEDAEDFAHRRGVRWIGKLLRDRFTPGALYELGATMTLFEVKTFCEELAQKFGAADAARLPPVAAPRTEQPPLASLDVVETTRQFISNKFRSELKGFPLEPFVAELFRAMGYFANPTRKVRDDGIDVIAHRDELGIQPPIIKIQVKAHEANIGADCVKAFYAMVHDSEVGVFITTGGYSGSARDFAHTKCNLRLYNGGDLADLVLKHYDRLGSQYRQQIPLRRVLIPDMTM